MVPGIEYVLHSVLLHFVNHLPGRLIGRFSVVGPKESTGIGVVVDDGRPPGPSGLLGPDDRTGGEAALHVVGSRFVVLLFDLARVEILVGVVLAKP